MIVMDGLPLEPLPYTLNDCFGPTLDSNSYVGTHEYKILIDGFISIRYMQSVFIQYSYSVLSKEDDFLYIKCIKTIRIF